MKELMMQETEQLEEQVPKEKPKRLELGQIVTTPGIRELLESGAITSQDIDNIIEKQRNCDWGISEDADTNDEAVINGDAMCLGAHMIGSHKIWVITEWDRSVSTILQPSEY